MGNAPTLAALLLPALMTSAALATPASRPPDTYTAVIYTTPQGCSYSRAQAPGYPPTWHLILNPQRVGLPVPTGRCPVML
ncbi:hypothetical protein [Nioella nitratireducens]|uniref:hypothetical protein n=1 Tax=Nioella nitratireducens TaxID=1287720 RepID=UPI0008FCF8B6|nr:hypothetical protein [Nioella nitratireducens]